MCTVFRHTIAWQRSIIQIKMWMKDTRCEKLLLLHLIIALLQRHAVVVNFTQDNAFEFLVWIVQTRLNKGSLVKFLCQKSLACLYNGQNVGLRIKTVCKLQPFNRCMVRQFTCMYASVTKQCCLVAAKGHWCSVAEEVSSFSPCVTDPHMLIQAQYSRTMKSRSAPCLHFSLLCISSNVVETLKLCMLSHLLVLSLSIKIC